MYNEISRIFSVHSIQFLIYTGIFALKTMKEFRFRGVD
jgi:hypothetical protein